MSIAKVEELSRWEAVKGQGTVSEESRGRILMKTREGSRVEVGQYNSAYKNRVQKKEYKHV